ncbi:hypothetical protein K445DRAFT_197693 [Daldinia sp. EC12]|nr:hypothetical protein K445DRAFT_197693 [Daldinia sp. EC12]
MNRPQERMNTGRKRVPREPRSNDHEDRTNTSAPTSSDQNHDVTVYDKIYHAGQNILIKVFTWQAWSVLSEIAVTFLLLALSCLNCARLTVEIGAIQLKEEIRKREELLYDDLFTNTPLMEKGKYFYYPSESPSRSVHRRGSSASHLLFSFMSSKEETGGSPQASSPDQSQPPQLPSIAVNRVDSQATLSPTKSALSPALSPISQAPSDTNTIRPDQPGFSVYREPEDIPSDSEADRQSLPLEAPLSPEQVRVATDRSTQAPTRDPQTSRAAQASSNLANMTAPPTAVQQLRQWNMPPDPSYHKDKQFDGGYVSQWLKEMDFIYDRYGVEDDHRIRDIPSWTVNRELRKRVEAAVQHANTWANAKDALKREFSARDPNQYKSNKAKLKDLQDGPYLRSPLELTDLISAYKTVFSDAADNTAERINENDYVEDVLSRIEDTTLKDILRQRRTVLSQVQTWPFSDVADMIREWAMQEIQLSERRNKRTVKFEQPPSMDDDLPRPSIERARQTSAARQRSPVANARIESMEDTLRNLTSKMDGLTINLQGLMERSFRTEQNQIANKPTPSPYVTPPNQTFDINQVQSYPNRSSQGRLYNPRSDRLDNLRMSSPYINNYPPDTCFFCCNNGEFGKPHRTPTCPIARELREAGIIHWDNQMRQYCTGHPDNVSTIRKIPIPNEVATQAKEHGDPIGAMILKYVYDQDIGGTYGKRAACYWSAKIAYESGRDDLKLQPVNPPQRSAPAQPDNRATEINSIRLDIDDNLIPIDYNWLHESAGDEGVTKIRAEIKKEMTEQLFDPLVEINAIKRRMGPNGEPIEVVREDEPTNETNESPDRESTKDKSIDEIIETKISQFFDSASEKFWQQKIMENAKKKFDVSWEDMIRFMPGFSEMIVKGISDNAKNKKVAPTRHVRVPISQVKKDAKSAINTVEFPSVQPNSIPASSNANEEVHINLLGKHSVTDRAHATPPPYVPRKKGAYYRPLLRLTIRIGPQGDEQLISGIVDTGAQTTIVCLSYVKRHRLPYRRSSVQWRPFGSEYSYPTVGQFDGPIWLAGYNLYCPIFIIEDKYCSSNLILGLNFVFESRMTTTFEQDGSMIGSFTFGPALIEVPLGFDNDADQYLEDVAGALEEPKN